MKQFEKFKKKTQKINVILFLIFLIVLITPVQGIVANSTTYTLGNMIQSTNGGVTPNHFIIIPTNDTWTDSLDSWSCVGSGCSYLLKTNYVYKGNYSIYLSAPNSIVTFSINLNETNATGVNKMIYYVHPGVKSYDIINISIYSGNNSQYYFINSSTPYEINYLNDDWVRIIYNFSDMQQIGSPNLNNLTYTNFSYIGNLPYGTVYFDGLTFTNFTQSTPTYSFRYTQHYQQPVGEFESTTYAGSLRWLSNTIYEDFLTHFIIQKQSCYDNDTLQVDTFLRFNNVDTLVLSEFVPCSLGCGQKGVPVCVNLQQEINFSYVGMISIIIAILFFLFSYALSKTEILKTLSITTAIFLTLFVASIATIPGGFSDNFLIDMIEGASSSIYITFALIVLGLVLFSFIFFFISWWRKKSLFQYGLEKEDFND